MHPADFGAASARKVIDDGYSAGDSPLERLANQVEELRRERAEASTPAKRTPRKKPDV
jgi:hypothetical protein